MSLNLQLYEENLDFILPSSLIKVSICSFLITWIIQIYFIEFGNNAIEDNIGTKNLPTQVRSSCSRSEIMSSKTILILPLLLVFIK